MDPNDLPLSLRIASGWYVSLNRYATKRDANEPEIIDALERVGAIVTQLDEPADLLVDFRQQWKLIEVKVSEKSKLTDKQVNFHSAHPGMVAIVWTPMMALKAVGAVGGDTTSNCAGGVHLFRRGARQCICGVKEAPGPMKSGFD